LRPIRDPGNCNGQPELREGFFRSFVVTLLQAREHSNDIENKLVSTLSSINAAAHWGSDEQDRYNLKIAIWIVFSPALLMFSGFTQANDPEHTACSVWSEVVTAVPERGWYQSQVAAH